MGQNYQKANAENVPDTINFEEYNDLLQITEEQEEHLKDTYMPIILNNISKEQYIKNEEQISLDFETDNYTYNTNSYELRLSEETLKNILTSTLNTLRTDTETLMLISNKLKSMGLGDSYSNTDTISTQIEELLSQIESIKLEESLDIIVYEYEGKLIRTIIDIDGKIKITYDRIDGLENLIIDIEKEIVQNIIENNRTDTNINGSFNNNNAEDANEEIIDLNNFNSTSNQNNITRIIISKERLDLNTVNKLQIIPDNNKIEENINIILNISDLQNNSINNTFIMQINTNNERKEVINIEYENTINIVEQVEEIEELSGSNTAIANNYNPNDFKNFLNEYWNILKDTLSQKMIIIGFDEFSEL